MKHTITRTKTTFSEYIDYGIHYAGDIYFSRLIKAPWDNMARVDLSEFRKARKNMIQKIRFDEFIQYGGTL